MEREAQDMETTKIQWEQKGRSSITIEAGRQILILPADSIVYVEAIGHKMHLSTVDSEREYEFRSKLESMLKFLPPSLYVRCHKSYIVNVMHVRKFERSTLTLSNGKQVPVGRKYASGLIACLRQFSGGLE